MNRARCFYPFFGTLLLLAVTPARAQIAGAPEGLDFFGHAVATGDFNGDGVADLAVGVRNEEVEGQDGAGAVNVIYGQAGSGLTDAGNQIWHQNSDGVEGAAEPDDAFGTALAAGDFDGDGFDDLAVGAPGETRDGTPAAGAAYVLYGSASGLSGTGSQLFVIDPVFNIASALGQAVAAGDFDGDGFADLALGAPLRRVDNLAAAGVCLVLYGSAGGLVLGGSQLWSQDTAGVQGAPEANDQFGNALVTGDFDGEGHDDLAVGVHLEAVGDLGAAGAVNVLYGSASGLSADGNQIWHQDIAGVQGVAQANDRFGHALAAGDFNGDGRSDLAVSAHFDDVGTVSNAGVVHVLHGTGAGLTADGDQYWSQNTANVLGTPGEDDEFGYALAAGDLDGDGRGDLAVGVRKEDVGAATDAGSANVLYGSAAGLATDGNQLWNQSIGDLLDDAEEGDWLGNALAAGDFDADGRGDLAVGVVLEDLGGLTNAGAVHVLYAAPAGGLHTARNQLLYQGATVVDTEPAAPGGLTAHGLDAASPNPFHTSATLRYHLRAPGPVHLAVYDGLGREIAVLASGLHPAGTHEAVLDGAGLPSGVYLVRMTTGQGSVHTQRVTLVR